MKNVKMYVLSLGLRKVLSFEMPKPVVPVPRTLYLDLHLGFSSSQRERERESVRVYLDRVISKNFGMLVI